MKQIFLSLFLIISTSLLAQYHPEVRVHLDKLSQTVADAPGVSIAFMVKVSHIQDDEELNSEKGELLIKGDYHKLTIKGMEIYGDSKSQWSYLAEEQEVTIEPLEEGVLTPANIFDAYKEGYRFRNLGEDEGKIIIELSPEDMNSQYIRIKLYIDKVNKRLDAFATQTKSGIITSVNITKWEIVNMPTKDVKYIQSAHPDVEVIDLR